jgi:hypothetical protein
MEFVGPIAKLPLPDEVFKNLKDATLGKDFSQHLAGVLEDQYLVNYEECLDFIDFIKTQSLEYLYEQQNSLIFAQIINSFRNAKWEQNKDKFDVRKHFDLNIDKVWLNSGSNSSYSPIHIHSGLFSFIVYVNIPYTFEEECKLNNNIEDNKNLNGCTEFIDNFFYSNIKVAVDKSTEGSCFLFPAWVPHVVYPFKSEGRRITISGNLYLTTKNVD